MTPQLFNPTLVSLPLCLIAIAAHAGTTTIIEDFEDGDILGGWSWGEQFGEPFLDQIEPVGGNPGGYLTHDFIQYSVPTPSFATAMSGDESLFNGNFAEKKVTSIGFDLLMLADSGPIPYDMSEWRIALVLESFNGTPGTTGDDTHAAIVFDQPLPDPRDGWTSFDVSVPSQSKELPDGWQISSTGFSQILLPMIPPHQTWEELIQDVSRVRFCFVIAASGLSECCDDTCEFICFYAIQNWFVGADNARISMDVSPADLDGDGSVGAADLALLLGAWGPCTEQLECPSDLDGNGFTDPADLALLLGDWG